MTKQTYETNKCLSRHSECRVENQEAVTLSCSAAECCVFVFQQIIQTRTRMCAVIWTACAHRHLAGALFITLQVSLSPLIQHFSSSSPDVFPAVCRLSVRIPLFIYFLPTHSTQTCEVTGAAAVWVTTSSGAKSDITPHGYKFFRDTLE